MLIATIAAGLVLLFVGGELLVRGAVLLGLRLGISSLVIGLTVVGFGTSTPELVTSLEAAWIGSPGIAIGNIVGSNIANVLLVLGLSAVLCPIAGSMSAAVRDGGLMLGAALALAGLALGGVLGRVDGLILITGLALYLWFMWRHGRENGGDPEPLPGEDMAQLQTKLIGGRSRALALTIEVGLVVLGIAAVVAGGAFLVRGAIELATIAGISQTVIGLTVVAIGTSLPELATSLVAAYRRQSDIAYGNVVGSTIFNILGIGGVTALTVPVEVPQHILLLDLPIMIGVILLMAIFVATGSRVTRKEGAVLITGYGAYLASLAALAP